MSARDSATQATAAIQKAGEWGLLAKLSEKGEASRNKLVAVLIVSTFCSLNLDHRIPENQFEWRALHCQNNRLQIDADHFPVTRLQARSQHCRYLTVLPSTLALVPHKREHNFCTTQRKYSQLLVLWCWPAHSPTWLLEAAVTSTVLNHHHRYHIAVLKLLYPSLHLRPWMTSIREKEAITILGHDRIHCPFYLHFYWLFTAPVLMKRLCRQL